MLWIHLLRNFRYNLIQKNDIALIIDTNIFGQIVSSIQYDELMPILEEWIRTILNKMKKIPKGKKITIFCSSDTLKDYKTGFSKQRHKSISKTIKLIFEGKHSHSNPIYGQEKINLSLRKISILPRPERARRVPDKDDEHFLLLVESVSQLSTHKNYEILFASKDRQSSDAIESVLKKSDQRDRIHVAEDLESFKELIAC